jgi:Txe/YoeB family toxin of Txe-Axe toxin-antitoxin module
MIKSSKVKFISKKLQENFNSLSEDDSIKKFIKRAIKDLQDNAFFGIQLPKRLIPKEYILKYGVKNLWKYDLPQGWRLIYTITAENEVQLISAILEWFNHPEYEKRFHY